MGLRTSLKGGVLGVVNSPQNTPMGRYIINMFFFYTHKDSNFRSGPKFYTLVKTLR